MVGLCRLCASLRKMDALISIQDDTNEICQKLRQCCQLRIHMQDALPKSLCQECLENLNSSHKFYMKVKDAQETLQTLFPSTNKAEANNVNKSCEALSQTLAAANDLNKKRKMSSSEREVASKKKKIVSKELEITLKNKVETTTQNLKNIETAEDKQINIISDDEVSVSLETAVNEKYLQEVYKMLDMTKEMAGDNSIEILETIDESDSEQIEDLGNENQEDECLEEAPFEEHHIFKDKNDAEEDILETLEQELLAGEENKDVVADDGKDLSIEIKYLQLESKQDEEEENDNEQSDIEFELIENDESDGVRNFTKSQDFVLSINHLYFAFIYNL